MEVEAVEAVVEVAEEEEFLEHEDPSPSWCVSEHCTIGQSMCATAAQALLVVGMGKYNVFAKMRDRRCQILVNVKYCIFLLYTVR